MKRSDAELLRLRAKVLSEPLVEVDSQDALVDIVVFSLSGERYGFFANKTGLVLPLQALCPIPGTPIFIRGMTRIEGELLPVVDIGPKLGIAPVDAIEGSPIIVLENNRRKFALIVENILASASVKPEELQPALQNGTGPADYFLHILADGTQILSVDSILNDESLVVRDE